MSDNAKGSYFFRAISGAEIGPVSMDELQRLVVARRVTAITQVRQSNQFLWRYACDLPELAPCFCPQPSSMPGGTAFTKPLAESSPAELLTVFQPYFRLLTNCFFFLIYISTALGVAVTAGQFLLLFADSTRISPGFSIPLPRFTEGVIALWAISLSIAPLLVWIAYHNRRLNWSKFFAAELTAYAVPNLAIGIWSLVTQHNLITTLIASIRM